MRLLVNLFVKFWGKCKIKNGLKLHKSSTFNKNGEDGRTLMIKTQNQGNFAKCH